ncbi:MAG: hypothetical protein WAM26_07340 [Nitrososphaeraceae archaeon]
MLISIEIPSISKLRLLMDLHPPTFFVHYLLDRIGLDLMGYDITIERIILHELVAWGNIGTQTFSS